MKKKRISERTIQNHVRKLAVARGAVCIKQGMPGPFGTAGWPDMLVIGPAATLGWHPSYFWIEFKAPGKKPTPLQLEKLAILQKLGCMVYVVSDLVEGERLIKARLG